MNSRIFMGKFIAIGQKTQTSAGPFGQGFNYWVEIGFELTASFDHTRARQVINQVLAQIDHRALGVDVNLGFEPTSENLCTWITNEISTLCNARSLEVRLLRGDGFVVQSQLELIGGTERPPAVKG